ncbi:HD domain-containing protein [Elongatibacter sediminis]|uniref:HD domain-containing protein n=1 Tax=Elongatibacter sediminis TaxID=3119006 RepID=A0AAW9R6H2_9GAMM
MKLQELQDLCEGFVRRVEAADHAHDIGHVQRVVRNTAWLTGEENADPWITLPAAWLHDCVAVAKDSPLRAQGSRLAADAAAEFLRGIGYPEDQLDAVRHAIEAHSYSAGIPADTLEARIVQDGDRLDSLGAIGIARCLLVGGRLNRPLASADDPFCDERDPDDSLYTIDHFHSKLLKLPDLMQTDAGRAEARRRAQRMQDWLDDLRAEMLEGHRG